MIFAKEKKIVAVFLLLASLLCTAEVNLDMPPAESDVELWQAFSLDFQLAKRVKFSLERQLRYDHQLTAFKSQLTEIGIRYKLAKFMAWQMNYRLTAKGHEVRHRLDGNIYFILKMKRFRISNRSRLQQEFISYQSSELLLRDRLQLGWQVGKKLFPYVGGEIFIGLSNSAKSENQYRLSAGMEYAVNKRIGLELFYYCEQDLVVEKDKTTHIFGGKFKYSLGKK
jgi:hypothetical protein